MTASPPPPAETPDTTPASLGADAVEYTHAFLAAVESLIHRPGDGLSLLDWRVAESTLDDHQREQILQGGALPTSACVNAARQDRDRRWQQGVMAALDTGAKLDQTLPETVEASLARQGIYAVLNVLRFDAELDQLPDEWPHIRAILRCYVLGYVREDDPEDLEALDRALEACGVAPLCEPEPRAAAAALRTVLRELLATRATRRQRFLLRSDFLHAHARGSSPRRGRYLLSVALSERRPLRPGDTSPQGAARSSQLFEDRDPNDQPTLPTMLVAPALIFLAALDRLEASAEGGWRGRRESAYHVLMIVSAEKRWPADIRTTMDHLLTGESLPDHEVFELARAAVVADAWPARSTVPIGPSLPGVAPADTMNSGEATPNASGPWVTADLVIRRVRVEVDLSSFMTPTGTPTAHGRVRVRIVGPNGDPITDSMARAQFDVLQRLASEIRRVDLGSSGPQRQLARRTLVTMGRLGIRARRYEGAGPGGIEVLDILRIAQVPTLQDRRTALARFQDDSRRQATTGEI